ncbi:hypothetical protein IVA80_11000 [Bradyrhizobium sp. 139]|uniref:hypothetical protein n=1 Tax=Bradyrhizobium sp. 139 TaxID=2782616 RepID=UPI001FF86923|nr:hypothetical protein [Bradyrhizobium sp. 139]MCK1741378.1 hypothetical protein [Bradyrhizobium sp. 139]
MKNIQSPHPSQAVEELRLRVMTLEAAMKVEDDPSLPLKTRWEREAGRKSLVDQLRGSVAEAGRHELCRRFGAGHFGPVRTIFSEPASKWIVQIEVNCADGKKRIWEDEVLRFPSDELIAEVALVT